MNELIKAIEDFKIIEKEWTDDYLINYHKTISGVHNLCKCIFDAEKNNHNPEIIHNHLSELKSIHGRSPFFKRIQEWPRGYQGDYETIEYLCENKNKVKNKKIEYYLEDYALNCNVAQQHRNKVNIQSKYMMETIIKNKNARILVVGCGSGRDIRNIQNIIDNFKYHIVFNDIDEEAINYTKKNLSKNVLKNSSFIKSNIIKFVKKEIEDHENFDLILFGGIFDYLNNRTIIFLLTNMYHKLLSDNGKILFTNININNPFRVWMEYLANWKLIERSQENCINLCLDSKIDPEKVKIFKEETGLTNIIEIKK